MSQLLEPDVLRELEVLRRRLEIAARSGRAGDHLSRRRGSSAEFEDHREYIAGDDLRRVDWLATARSGIPVVKRFRAEEDPLLRVLVDTSGSLDFGTPTKLDMAKRLAAAVGYLALSSGALVQLITKASADTDRVRFYDPRRGRGGVFPFLHQLEPLSAAGRTRLAEWVQQVLSTVRRPGMLVLISDFLDPDPVLRQLDLARTQGHELALLQVLSREELEPAWDGDLMLEDSETHTAVELTLDQSALDAYTNQLLLLFEQLRGWSRQRGQAYVRVTTEDPLADAMRRFIARGQD